MNRKKLSVIFFVGFAIISGCGKSVSEIKDSNLVENDTLEGDITFSTEETSGDSNEGFVQMSADELLDRFVNGEVSAHCLYDTAKTFYITELDMDSEEWDAYSIGDREDLDNDGEEELILCGPYGGKYLDARDGEVYEFAAVGMKNFVELTLGTGVGSGIVANGQLIYGCAGCRCRWLSGFRRAWIRLR